MVLSTKDFVCGFNEQRFAIAFKWLGKVKFCFSLRNLPDIQYFKHTDIAKLMKTFVLFKKVAFLLIFLFAPCSVKQ